MTQLPDQFQSMHRFRWLGYGLLLFALVDVAQVLSPLKLTNPVWELQTIGTLVERVTVPLLGMALVFFGELSGRTILEKIVLKLLSWLCLGLAIVFLLLVPLGIMGTARLDTQNNQQINQQVEQRITQLNQLENRLNQGTAEEIKTVAVLLNKVGLPVNGQDAKDLKSQGLTRISQARLQLQEQSEVGRANQQSTLLKSSIRWNLGALISSVLFFVFWRTSHWAR